MGGEVRKQKRKTAPDAGPDGVHRHAKRVSLQVVMVELAGIEPASVSLYRADLHVYRSDLSLATIVAQSHATLAASTLFSCPDPRYPDQDQPMSLSLQPGGADCSEPPCPAHRPTVARLAGN